MPSNGMYVCLDCRVGSKGSNYPNCLRDSHRTRYFGKKITVPKKNNARAWKRIENGEFRWNRRKTKNARASVETWQVYRNARKKGRRPSLGRGYGNQNIDLGG